MLTLSARAAPPRPSGNALPMSTCADRGRSNVLMTGCSGHRSVQLSVFITVAVGRGHEAAAAYFHAVPARIDRHLVWISTRRGIK